MGDDTRRIANCGASFPSLLSEEGTCAGRTVFQHRESARGRRGSARTNHRRWSAQRRTAEKAEMRAILEKVPPRAVFDLRLSLWRAHPPHTQRTSVLLKSGR